MQFDKNYYKGKIWSNPVWYNLDCYSVLGKYIYLEKSFRDKLAE